MNPNCPSASLRIESEKNILQLCLELHEYCNGNSPDLRNHEEVFNQLVFAKNTWVNGKDSSKLFDSCVLDLIKATIFDYERKVKT